VAEDTDLFAELEADQRGASPACTVAVLLAAMPADERASFEAAFRNPAYTSTSILRALHRRNYKIGDQPVMRHARRIRKGIGCLCPI
jgi:hypothetical protein